MHTLQSLCWCVEGKEGELVQPGSKTEDCLEICGTSGWRKLCMVLCDSCHMYGIWRSKEVRKAKVIIGGGNASHQEGQFLWERGVLIM